MASRTKTTRSPIGVTTSIEVFNEIPIKELRADSLTELDLLSKRIGQAGAIVLAGLVPVSASLTSLNLRGNEIGDEGAKALAAGVAASASLTKLDVRHCGIFEEAKQALQEAVKGRDGFSLVM